PTLNLGILSAGFICCWLIRSTRFTAISPSPKSEFRARFRRAMFFLLDLNLPIGPVGASKSPAGLLSGASAEWQRGCLHAEPRAPAIHGRPEDGCIVAARDGP